MAILAPLLFGLLSASSTTAAPSNRGFALEVRANPVYPSQDPFYQPPSGFQTRKPGTILNFRPVPNGLAGLSNAKAAFQLLYRTSDNSGNPEAAVTTVVIPSSPNPLRLLSYQVPYDSADVDCSPSYALQSGSSSNTSLVTGDSTYINNALGDGYYITIPDYEGPSGAFTAGLQAGYATLDSVRATLQSQFITGLSPKASYAMWGYSGGALASEWAAELQASYAPELKFIGAALGGLTPNVTSVLYTVNGGAFAGLVPAGIIGLSRAYPNFTAYLQQALIPSKAAAFYMAGQQCLLSDVTEFIAQNISTYFTKGLAVLQDPIPLSVINNAGVMGLHGVPKMPLYVYKAVGDEVSPVADTDALVNKYCSSGATIQYIRDLIGGHLLESATGASGALSYITDRFNGVAVTPGCQIQTTLR